MPDWNPSDASPWLTVHRHEVPGARGSRTVAIRHPGRAFVRACRSIETLAQLEPFAFEYLASLWPLLQLPSDRWLRDLAPARVDGSDLDDIACVWLTHSPGDPRSSRWFERRAGDHVLHRSAILVAGLALRSEGGRAWPLYGGQGIAVAVEVDDAAGCARIAGLTCTLPPIDKTQRRDRLAEVVSTAETELFRAFGLGDETYLHDYGLHIVDEETVDVVALVASDPAVAGASAATGWFRAPEMLVARWRAGKGFVPISRTRRAAHAARMLDQDPVSKAGSASFWQLRPYKGAVDGQAEARPVPGGLPLSDAYVEVVQSRWTVGGTADLPGQPVRGEDAATLRGRASSALHAFRNVGALFVKMNEWGLEPKQHLPFMAFPLQVEHRAGITPGPGGDGRTVNAQVQWGQPGGRGSFLRVLGGAPDAERLERTPMVVRFALADLRGATDERALGLATDPRWCWHELSHVLLGGATGELEFRFAHSAGDALGAILCDPDSRLAGEPGWRGVSFPWVFLPRRHDRRAEDGWGWSGSHYLGERFYTTPHLCDRRTYWTEQIMSSTLFHLYRLLGGDAMMRTASGADVPDVAARRSAADYAAYLIVAAIVRRPAEAVVTHATPELFAASLAEADRATATFGTAPYLRRGGAAAKLIDHAFQRQGLGHPPGTLAVDAPAKPLVDLYADDGRGGDYPPATFLDETWMRSAAIVLRGSATPGPDEGAIAGRRTHVYVRYGNRGTAVASAQTCARVHVAPWAGDAPPPWPDPAWQAIGEVPVVGAGGLAGPVAWDVPGGASRYAVLAELSDEADASLIDPASGAPCALASGDAPVTLLVVGDNNLALRRVAAV